MTLSQKLGDAISYFEKKKCEGSSSKMTGKHLYKELEIFDVTGEKTKNIKLLLNSLKTNFHRIRA